MYTDIPPVATSLITVCQNLTHLEAHPQCGAFCYLAWETTACLQAQQQTWSAAPSWRFILVLAPSTSGRNQLFIAGEKKIRYTRHSGGSKICQRGRTMASAELGYGVGAPAGSMGRAPGGDSGANSPWNWIFLSIFVQKRGHKIRFKWNSLN